MARIGTIPEVLGRTIARYGVRCRVRLRLSKKSDWGIVVLPSKLINQRGEVVQQGEHKLMIRRRPLPTDGADTRR